MNLGFALADQGKLEEAIDVYRRAAERLPNSVRIYNGLGTALARAGRSEEAVDCYRRALELDADDRELRNNLGNSLRELGQLEEAEAQLRRAIELRPDYPEAHNNLAVALIVAARPVRLPRLSYWLASTTAGTFGVPELSTLVARPCPS